MKNIAAYAFSKRVSGIFAFNFLMALVLTGCETMPQKTVVDFAELRITPVAAAPAAASKPSNGSLYQAASYRPAFEDRRARLVGDTVTIQITESLTASQVSSSTANRDTTISSAISALPLQTAAGLGKFDLGASSKNDFSGKGGTQSANTFAGTITATVVDVLPNGNLIVTGEKQIGVNHNVDVLRFSGTVDPRLLQPGSVIASTQVANVRVESRGRGPQGEAQTVGWLSRFFLSFHPF
jgi:flagellar L-ring protein precursor FlgH